MRSPGRDASAVVVPFRAAVRRLAGQPADEDECHADGTDNRDETDVAGGRRVLDGDEGDGREVEDEHDPSLTRQREAPAPAVALPAKRVAAGRRRLHGARFWSPRVQLSLCATLMRRRVPAATS